MRALTLAAFGLALAAATVAGGSARADALLRRTGTASVYADLFEGRETASGDTFRQGGMTAASPDLPLGSRIRVTYPETGRTVRLAVTDRGPFVDGRMLDLSKAAADRLGIDLEDGVVTVLVEVFAADQPTAALRRAVQAHGQRQ